MLIIECFKQECQTIAWAHHHKYECKTISEMKDKATYGMDDERFISTRNFRTALRILCLHAKKQLPDAFRAELFSLETHYSTQSQKEEYSMWAIGCARMFHDYNITNLGLEKVLQIIYAVSFHL